MASSPSTSFVSSHRISRNQSATEFAYHAPRHTTKWIGLTVGLCVVTLGAWLFFGSSEEESAPVSKSVATMPPPVVKEIPATPGVPDKSPEAVQSIKSKKNTNVVKKSQKFASRQRLRTIVAAQSTRKPKSASTFTPDARDAFSNTDSTQNAQSGMALREKRWIKGLAGRNTTFAAKKDQLGIRPGRDVAVTGVVYTTDRKETRAVAQPSARPMSAIKTADSPLKPAVYVEANDL